MKKLSILKMFCIAALLLVFAGCKVETDSDNPVVSNSPKPSLVTKTYTVTIGSVEHGSVTADKASGIAQGETVTLTVSADDKYKLKTLSAADGNGADVALTTVTQGTTYTFTMPESNVTVSASFEEKLKAGDIAKAAITIGTTTYDKTAEVYATGLSGASITGKLNTNNYAGVFINERTVTLSPFIMSKYEVTQELYTAVMTDQKVTVGETEYTLDASPFYCKETGGYLLVSGETQKYRPAEGVTWYDAVYFCNALSEKTGLTKAYNITITSVDATTNGHIIAATVELVSGANGYRLPTEAEWEFTARGGDPTAAAWDYTFSGAATAEGTSYVASKNTGLDSVGWYWYNSVNGTTGDTVPSFESAGYGTHQVGLKNANSLGIYDMSGNVWEWCYDWYGTVETGTAADPSGVSSGSSRILRGGSWLGKRRADIASVCCRVDSDPDYRREFLGFRVCRSAQ